MTLGVILQILGYAQPVIEAIAEIVSLDDEISADKLAELAQKSDEAKRAWDDL